MRRFWVLLTYHHRNVTEGMSIMFLLIHFEIFVFPVLKFFGQQCEEKKVLTMRSFT